MIWDGSPFGGAKLAAMHGDALLAYARDDKPGIPYPGMIDLPGGGREGDETPEDCVLRELTEEFGITLPAERLYYHRVYVLADGATVSHFFAVHLSEADVAGVKFGDEGQDWALMPAADFIADDHAVPKLREWVAADIAATR